MKAGPVVWGTLRAGAPPGSGVVSSWMRTLRDGAVGFGAAGGNIVGQAGRAGSTMLVSSEAKSLRVLDWVSVQGARAEAGAGLWRASVISRRQAMIVSVVELGGIATLVGYQDRVSQMRVAQESQIQTL
jgi:hypothetical protein